MWLIDARAPIARNASELADETHEIAHGDLAGSIVQPAEFNPNWLERHFKTPGAMRSA